jgi:signal transduction histidine kinase
VLLTIDDDGPGIPVAERDRVFERFTRLDASRTRAQRGGAGLGLALARSVVEYHHGSIAVGDSPYRGARLSIVLPALGP